jgi:hypothetical protein
LVVTTTLLLVGYLTPTAGATVIACNIGNYGHHRFAGFTYRTGVNTLEGVKAEITSRWGYICDTDTNDDPQNGGNFTSAWVMVASAADVNGFHHAYSQSGIMRMVNGASNHIFAESERDDRVYAYQRTWGGAISYGDIRPYWTQFVDGASCTDRFRNNYNTTVIQTTSWSPLCNAAMTAPWEAQYESEALYPSTDINGINGSSTHFGSMQYQSVTDDAWYATADGVTSGNLDNPTTGSALAAYCASVPLSCDTYSRSAMSGHAFNSNTTNPH